jgi:prevent-host-death family protein
MSTWALQDAKAQFSRVVGLARSQGPQMVTRHGRAAVVVLAAEQFQRMTRREGPEDLAAFFAKSPLAGLDLGRLERDRDPGRESPL